MVFGIYRVFYQHIFGYSVMLTPLGVAFLGQWVKGFFKSEK